MVLGRGSGDLVVVRPDGGIIQSVLAGRGADGDVAWK